MLTVINIFSISVLIIPLTKKTGQEVAKRIFKISKDRRPSKIWVGKGGAFYNKDVRKLVELYFTDKNEKNLVWSKYLTELLGEIIQVFYRKFNEKIYWRAWRGRRAIQQDSSFVVQDDSGGSKL